MVADNHVAPLWVGHGKWAPRFPPRETDLCAFGLASSPLRIPIQLHSNTTFAPKRLCKCMFSKMLLLERGAIS